MVRRKVQKKQEDSDDGSAELMSSFADMMTLLLGFFIILYSMSHMDEKKFYEMGKSIASSFKQVQKDTRNQVVEAMVEQSRQLRAFQMLVAILNLGDEASAIERIEREYSEKVEAAAAGKIIQSGIEKLPGAEKMSTVANDGPYAEIELGTNSLFKSGSDDLDQTSTPRLSRLAAVLARVQTKSRIEIIGHTDALPPAPGSKFEDNWALSSARAAAIARTLIAYGIDGEKISVKGRAHYEPIFPEVDTKGVSIPENRAKNRRVSIRVVREGAQNENK